MAPSNRPSLPIFLDYQSTTPCDPRVLDRMLPYFTTIFGNPHSSDHRHGWDADAAITESRGQIAALIGAKQRDIIFTSGATEANNLAIKGAMAKRRAEGRTRVITLATEHKCVLESAGSLSHQGYEVEVLPVQQNGLLDIDLLQQTLRDDVGLVSIMAANNEIGVLQPLAEIGALCRAVGAWFHTDAAQAFGKIPLDVDAMNIDLMSISGHKIYGPKGIGALYIRGKRPKVTVAALIDGGGQERGMRSGTLPTPLCVGMGAAAEIAANEFELEADRLRTLRDQLWRSLKERRPNITVNGDMNNRLAGNLNLTVPGLEGSELLASLDKLSVSAGSACSSGAQAASHVLQALGQDPGIVAAGLRIGLGRFTTNAEIDAAQDMLLEAIPE